MKTKILEWILSKQKRRKKKKTMIVVLEVDN